MPNLVVFFLLNAPYCMALERCGLACSVAMVTDEEEALGLLHICEKGSFIHLGDEDEFVCIVLVNALDERPGMLRLLFVVAVAFDRGVSGGSLDLIRHGLIK